MYLVQISVYRKYSYAQKFTFSFCTNDETRIFCRDKDFDRAIKKME